MLKMKVPLGMAMVLALSFSTPTYAVSTAEAEAEHTRLAEEMKKLGGRNAWRGVDAKYVQMLELEQDGAALSYNDHWLGAQAARDMGRITDVYFRLLRAKDVEPKKEALDWLAEIDSKYGQVKLDHDSRYKGETTLTPEMMPFAPDQRAAIGAATLVIDDTEKFAGLLPFGKYTYGETVFEVVEGGGLVDVYLEPKVKSKKGGGESRRRRDGLRIELGPAYTVVGDTKAKSLQAQGFAGGGVRAGAGWELELFRSVGLTAQGGYQGILMGENHESNVTTNPVTETVRDGLNLFYASAQLTYWFGDLGLTAGPSWAGGIARTKGITSNCGTGEGCEQVGDLTDATYDEIPVKGTVMTGGWTSGLFYGFVDIPGVKNGRGGISLNVGSQTDATRFYPWAQIAFTIAPAS